MRSELRSGVGPREQLIGDRESQAVAEGRPAIGEIPLEEAAWGNGGPDAGVVLLVGGDHRVGVVEPVAEPERSRQTSLKGDGSLSSWKMVDAALRYHVVAGGMRFGAPPGDDRVRSVPVEDTHHLDVKCVGEQVDGRDGGQGVTV